MRLPIKGPWSSMCIGEHDSPVGCQQGTTLRLGVLHLVAALTAVIFPVTHAQCMVETGQDSGTWSCPSQQLGCPLSLTVHRSSRQAFPSPSACAALGELHHTPPWNVSHLPSIACIQIPAFFAQDLCTLNCICRVQGRVCIFR